MPIGIGYLGWELDNDPLKATQMLQIALTSNVQSIWLSFGNDLRSYVEFIRKADATKGEHSRKTLIAIQVSSSADALTAVNELKADVVIVQGTLLSRYVAYISVLNLLQVTNQAGMAQAKALPYVHSSLKSSRLSHPVTLRS